MRTIHTRRRLTLAGIVLSTAVALSSCGSESAAEFVKKGDDLLAKKQLPQALLAYRQAVVKDPKSGVARRKLADAYWQTNEAGKALEEYVRAADLLGSDIDAQIQAGNILLLANRFEDAKGRADKALALDPKNTDALVLKGNAYAGLKNLDDALKEMETAITIDPSRGSSYLNLGLVQSQLGEADKAEATYKKAIAGAPDAVIPRLALMNLYWNTGRLAQAEKVMTDALAIEPSNNLLNRALAMFYLSTGRRADAEAPLKVILAKDPQSDIRFTLADYYALTNRLSEAKALLQSTANDSRADYATAAKLRLAALGFVDGDLATTRKLVDEILAKTPNLPEALIAKAQLFAVEGNRAEALSTIRRAADANPDSVSAHHVAGKLLTADLQFDAAVTEQKRVLQLNSSYAPAFVELTRLSLWLGRFDEAVTYGREAVRLAPNQAEAHYLLARAEINSGHPDDAARSLRALVAALPNDAVVRAEIGRMQLAQKDVSGAQASFEKAIALDKRNVNAIEGLITIDLLRKDTASARRRADAALRDQPNDALILIIAGRTYLGTGDAVTAEKFLRQAIQGGASDMEAFGLLASIYVQQGKLVEAIAEFRSLSKRRPSEAVFPAMVGTLLHVQGKFDEAKVEYERALSVNPKSAVAANNLAQLYVDRDENLDMALQLAQTAKANSPKSHEIDDTLGWIYYKKKIASQALNSMKAAVTAQPENPVYLYHLGAAYALNKDKSNARQALEKALKLQPNFPGADDARRILTSLN